MRVLPAILAAVVLAGCDREPILSPVPVSPADLRASLPEVQKTGSSMVKDDDGKARVVHYNTQVDFQAEPPKHAETMNLSVLVSACARPDSPSCDLDDRKKHPRLYVDSGDAYYNPQWGTIGGYAFVLGVGGGVVGLETYCFVNCGTGGKVALVTVDVVGAVVGTIAVLGFIAAMDHGLAN